MWSPSFTARAAATSVLITTDKTPYFSPNLKWTLLHLNISGTGTFLTISSVLPL